MECPTVAEINFDATTVAPQTPFEVLPAGKYVVQIDASEMKPTRDGNGQYLWLELGILDGEYAGRKLFDRLNLVNANAQAQEIAQRTLSAICHATGQLHVADSEQLHGRPIVATVRVRQGRTENGQTYDPSNEIRGYAPVSAAPHPMNQAKPAVQTAAKPAAAAVPPWRRKTA
jgi:hypothetical protein